MLATVVVGRACNAISCFCGNCAVRGHSGMCDQKLLTVYCNGVVCTYMFKYSEKCRTPTILSVLDYCSWHFEQNEPGDWRQMLIELGTTVCMFLHL